MSDSMKYKCEYCNYSTGKLFNYKIHLKSKKHISASEGAKSEVSKKESSDSILVKNSQKTVVCEYCNKKISYKRNKARHLSVCKEKKIKESEISKDNIINTLSKEKEERDRLIREQENLVKEKENLVKEKEKREKFLLEENKQLLLEKQDISQRYIEDLKNMGKELMDALKANNNGNTTITNINIDKLNILNIMQHFTNTPNYENLMAPPFTEEEKEYILKNGPTEGCYNYINKRCIEGKPIEERPIHCVDVAREKYVLRTNDNWIVDIKGNIILDTAYKPIRTLYHNMHNPRLEAENVTEKELEQITKDYKEIALMKTKMKRGKIMNRIRDSTKEKTKKIENK